MTGGTIVTIDVPRLQTALVDRGYCSMRSFSLSIGMLPSQLAHTVKRGRCRSDMLARIERGLALAPGALSTDGAGKSRPRSYRQLKGWSVKQLSEKSGVSTGVITRLERGEGDCYAFTAACLSKALGIPMGVYLGYEE